MSRPPMPPAHGGRQSPYGPPGQQGAPPSFKTNVNRNKTRKWVDARPNTYDGDEWDGRDPYGEYGTYDKPAPINIPPYQARQHSFDDRRAFSAGVSPSRGRYDPALDPPQAPYAARPRSGSHDSRDRSRGSPYRQNPYAPPPVPQHSQMGPHDGNRWGPPDAPEHNPATALPLRDASNPDSNEKPAAAIPFIRPSDIYARMQQEREKEQSRPNSSDGVAAPDSHTQQGSALSNVVPPIQPETSPARPAVTPERSPARDPMPHVQMAGVASQDFAPNPADVAPIPPEHGTFVPEEQEVAHDDNDFRGRTPTAAYHENRISTIIEEPASPVTQLSSQRPPSQPRSRSRPSKRDEPISSDLNPADFPWVRRDSRDIADSHTADAKVETSPVRVQHESPVRSTIIVHPPEEAHSSPPNEKVEPGLTPKPGESDANWTAIASPPTGHAFEPIGSSNDGSGSIAGGEAVPATAAEAAQLPADTGALSTSGARLQPLQLDHTALAVTGNVPPTPPAKDTPKPESHQNDEEYFDSNDSVEGPRSNSFGGADENEFTESDRLHEDIVRSLTPAVTRTSADEVTPGAHVTLRDEPQSANGGAMIGSESTSKPVRPDLPEHRFSWEDRESTISRGPDPDLPDKDEASKQPPRLLTTDIPSGTLTDDRLSPGSSTSAREGRPSLSSEYPPNSALSDARAGRDGWPAPEEYVGLGTVPETPIQDSAAPARAPRFREILAIVNTGDRIATYNTTRKHFVETDTGLQNWLVTTMAARPEHNHLNIAGPTFHPGAAVPSSVRHRPGQSIVRMAKGLKPEGGDSQESGHNVEKMQAMGKDLLSSAGKLGGKSVVGAKGWIAKGRQKLRETSSGGGDKVNRTTPSTVAATAPHRSSTTSVKTPQPPPQSQSIAAKDERVDGSSASRAVTREVQIAPEVLEPTRPDLQERQSSSRSIRRLSATFDRILSNVPDLSKPRSRPLSLASPSGTSDAVHAGAQPESADRLAGETTKVNETPLKSQDAPERAAVWASPAVHTDTNGVDERRLGILPTPVSQSFDNLPLPVAQTPVEHTEETHSAAPVSASLEREQAAPRLSTISVNVASIAPRRVSLPADKADVGRTSGEVSTKPDDEIEFDRLQADTAIAPAAVESADVTEHAAARTQAPETSALEISAPPSESSSHQQHPAAASEVKVAENADIEPQQKEKAELAPDHTTLDSATQVISSIASAAISVGRSESEATKGIPDTTRVEPHTSLDPEDLVAEVVDTDAMEGEDYSKNDYTVLTSIPEASYHGSEVSHREQPLRSPQIRNLPWSDSPVVESAERQATLAALEGNQGVERHLDSDTRYYQTPRRFSFGIGADDIESSRKEPRVSFATSGPRATSQPLPRQTSTMPASHTTNGSDSDNQTANRGKLVKKGKRVSSVASSNPSSDVKVVELAAPAVEKKKRFSGLGSFFGRNSPNTKQPVADVKPEPSVPRRNRLSKQVPMTAALSTSRDASPAGIPMPPDFQRQLRPSDQITLADDNTHPRGHTPVSRRSSMASNPVLGNDDSTTPVSRQLAEPTIPNLEPVRRLHSARPMARTRHSYADPSDGFRSIDSSAQAPNVDRSRGNRASDATSRSSSANGKRLSWQFSTDSEQASPRYSPVPSRRASAHLEHHISSSSAENGGYFIPMQRRSSPFSPFRNTGTERVRPGQASRSSSYEMSGGLSAKQSQRSSVYSRDEGAGMNYTLDPAGARSSLPSQQRRLSGALLDGESEYTPARWSGAEAQWPGEGQEGQGIAADKRKQQWL